MCGIIGFNSNNARLGKQMTDRIAHRGPDDDGVFSDERVTLGNRRLAIIDLSPAGHQPMASENTVIAYNGEIYNFQELKQELYVQSRRFKSNSDTEVILQGYEVYGTEVFQKLRGMWACAIYDKVKRKVILSRDFFGIKPLYYFFDGSQFAFASEIKGLDVELKIGDVGSYFLLGYTPAPNTIYENIFKLMPGEILEFDLVNKKIEKSRIVWNEPSSGSFEEIMRESVKRHLIADVPIGVFLSGGMDSTTIALMLKKLGAHLKAYTVRIPGKQDADYAKKIAAYAGLDHHEIVFDQTAYEDTIETCFSMLDEPVADTSLLPSLAVAKRAARDVKVVLTGEGADELFLGYDKYWKFQWRFFQNRDIRDAYNMFKRVAGDPAFYDRTMYLPDDLLYKTDFATMAYSVEGRVPFLDRGVWAFARSLSASQKMRKQPIKKYLLQHLPADLIMRKKEGFSIPSSLFSKHPDLLFAYQYAREFLPNLPSRESLSGRFLFALLVFYKTTHSFLK